MTSFFYFKNCPKTNLDRTELDLFGRLHGSCFSLLLHTLHFTFKVLTSLVRRALAEALSTCRVTMHLVVFGALKTSQVTYLKDSKLPGCSVHDDRRSEPKTRCRSNVLRPRPNGQLRRNDESAEKSGGQYGHYGALLPHGTPKRRWNLGIHVRVIRDGASVFRLER